MSKWEENTGDQYALDEEIKHEFKKPSLYNVILLNDDYTPMDFVIEVLTRFFNMDEDKASDIMLTIHYKGKALCGTYTADVAETKVDQVLKYALEHEHPLKCIMEQS